MNHPTGRPVRYTVRFTLQPDDRQIEFAVVTAFGLLKAVAVAAGRLQRLEPETQIAQVVKISEEHEFTVDPARDLLDYWETS